MTDQDLQQASRSGYCVPVVGAGASIAAGLPDWNQLVEAHLIGLPEFYRGHYGSSDDKTEVLAYLMRERHYLRLPPIRIPSAVPSAIHTALTHLQCSLYLTTNFDDLLETALRANAPNVKVLGNKDLTDVSLSDLYSEPRHVPPVLVKLCSERVNYSTGALSRSHFAELILRDTAALDLLTTVLRTKVVLFVGCSMKDPLIEAALDRIERSGLGFGRHFALMAPRTSESFKSTLKDYRINPIAIEHDSIAGYLSNLAPARHAASKADSILIIEPGTLAKARQVLNAVQAIDKDVVDIAKLDFVTENADLAASIRTVADEVLTRTPYRVIVSQRIADVTTTAKDLRRLANQQPEWTCAFTPFEFHVLDSARVAVALESDGLLQRHGHEPRAAEICRGKALFRDHLQTTFANDPHVAPIKSALLDISADLSAMELFDLIRAHQAFAADLPEELVIKPVDAAGSIGVRPFRLDRKESALMVLEDFLKVVRGMPFKNDTRWCDANSAIVEERLRGGEFSVESVVRGPSGNRDYKSPEIEPLAVHWKVDIDDDPSRFFERLFVTVPDDTEISEKLRQANEALLGSIPGIGSGVTHAEFRYDVRGQRVHPLEIGLRPGGGMVSASAAALRGVDLFEEALLAGLRRPNRQRLQQGVIGTGLIFAATPGLLNILEVQRLRKDGSEIGRLAICKEHTDVLLDTLNANLQVVDRTVVFSTYLARIIGKSNPWRESVVEAFGTSADAGLRAEIRRVDIWMGPGELIAEEEASYVAGILVAVDPTLTGRAAVAEAVAAVELSLRSINCSTIRPPRFEWHKVTHLGEWIPRFERSHFRSDPDSRTYSQGLELAIRESRRLHLVDLGCGSGIPALPLLSSGRLHRYTGIDIDPAAVEVARRNFLGTSTAPCQSVCHVHDVTCPLPQELITDLQGDIIGANLPYLPAPSEASLPREVNGGPDGLRLVPDTILDIATQLGSSVVAINFSSLSNVEAIIERVARRGLGVISAVATVAPLEKYALAVLPYLKSLPVRKFARFVGAGLDQQIIYCFVLSTLEGVPPIVALRAAQNAVVGDAGNPVSVGTTCIGGLYGDFRRI